jgi:hypothetical protein
MMLSLPEPRTILEIAFPFRFKTAKGHQIKCIKFKLIDSDYREFGNTYELCVTTSDVDTQHIIWTWLNQIQQMVDQGFTCDYKDTSTIVIGDSQLVIYGMWPRDYQELVDGRTEIRFSVDHCVPTDI